MDYKNNILNVTFLLTLYDAKDDEITYWKSVYLLFKKKNIQFKWLFDKGEKTISPSFVDKSDIFISNKRKGKLNLVYDYIKEKKVDTIFFKTLDPDDTISFGDLEKVVFPKEACILTTGFFSYDCYIKNEEKSECIKNPNAFWSASTFIPTESILNDHFYENDLIINQWEDDLLGFISLLNGYEWRKTVQPWYIYKINNGISNSEKLIDYLDEMDEVLRIFRDMQKKSGILEENDFPRSIKIKIDDFLDKYSNDKIEKAREILKKYGVN